MERINTSKKSIIEDWQNTLKDIQERDKNLTKLKEFNKDEEMKILTINSEIQGVNREYLNEAALSEKRDENIRNLANELQSLKSNKEVLENELKRLDTKIRMLKESISHKETDK